MKDNTTKITQLDIKYRSLKQRSCDYINLRWVLNNLNYQFKDYIV